MIPKTATSEDPFDAWVRSKKATATQTDVAEDDPFRQYTSKKKEQSNPFGQKLPVPDFQFTSDSVLESTEPVTEPTVESPTGFLEKDIEQTQFFSTPEIPEFDPRSLAEPTTPQVQNNLMNEERITERQKILSEPDALSSYAKDRVNKIKSEIQKLENVDLERFAEYGATSVPGAPLTKSFKPGAESVQQQIEEKKRYLNKFQSALSDQAAFVVGASEDLTTVDDAKLKSIGAKYLKTMNDTGIASDEEVLRTIDDIGANKTDIDRTSQNINYKLYKAGADVMAKYYNDVADKTFQEAKPKLQELNSLLQQKDAMKPGLDADLLQSSINDLMQDPQVKSYIDSERNASTYLKKSNDAINEFPQVKRQAMRQQLNDAFFNLTVAKQSASKDVGSLGMTLGSWLFGEEATEGDVKSLAKATGIPEDQVNEIIGTDIKGWFGAAKDAGIRIPGALVGVAQSTDETIAKAVMGSKRFFNTENVEAENRLLSDRVQDYNLKAQKAKLFDDAGKLNFNPYSVFNTMGSGIGQTAVYAAPSLLTGGLAANISGIDKIGKLVSMATTTGTGFVGSYEDAYKEAKQYTTDEDVARSYATKVGLVNGLSEIFLEPADVAKKLAIGSPRGKDAFSAFSKMYKDKGAGAAMAQGLKEFGKVVGTENIEELSALIGETKFKESELGIKTSPAEFINQAIETAVTTTLTTLPLGVGAGMNANRDVSSIRKQALFEAGNEPDLYRDRLKTLLDNGTIDQKHYNDRVAVVNTMSGIVANINQSETQTGKKLSYDQKSNLAAQQFRIDLDNKRLKSNGVLEAEKPLIEADIKEATEIQRQELEDEIIPQETPTEAGVPEVSVNEKEQAAIEGLQNKDFANSPIKPYTDVIQNPDASIADKKEALKGLSDQLTAKGTEITVGEALGKEADLIYGLGYEPVVESEAIQSVTEPVQEDIISVGELIDKTVTRNGERGTILQDGQTLIFKPEGKDVEFELGNVDELKNESIKDFGIEQESSVVSVDDTGALNVRGKTFQNKYSDPFQAINRNKDGEILSVTLDTEDGKKRTFRGQVAEDLAYEITLQQISKNNEQAAVEDFINEDEQSREEIINEQPTAVAEEEPVADTQPIQRKKIERKPRQIPYGRKVVQEESGLTKNADLIRDVIDDHSVRVSPLSLEEKDNIHSAINDYEQGSITGDQLKDILLKNGIEEEFLSQEVVGNLEDSTVTGTGITEGGIIELTPKEKLASEKSLPSYRAKYPGATQEEYQKNRVSGTLKKDRIKKAENKPTISKEPAIVKEEPKKKAPSKKKLTSIEDVENELRDLFAMDRMVGIPVGEKTNTIDQYLEKAKAVLSQLYPDATITTYDTAEEYYDKEGRPVGSAGVFHPQEQRLALNLELIAEHGAENTIFHEVIHPIVNEAILSKEGALDDVFEQLKELKGIPGMDAVHEHIQAYAGRGINIQKVEGITEFLTQVADGKIDLSGVPEKTSSKVIDLINKIFEALGISLRISTATDLKRLSDAIKTSFDNADASAVSELIGRRADAAVKESFDAILPEEQERIIKDIISRSEGVPQEQLKATIKKYTGWSDEKIDSFFVKSTGITHSQTKETASEFSFEGYEPAPETFDEWDKEAMSLIESGYDIEGLIKRLEEGKLPTNIEQRIMGFYLATQEAAVEKDPSKDNVEKLMRAVRASDVGGGRLVGQSLAARKGFRVRDNSLAGFFIGDEEANEAPLTDNQRREVVDEYNEIQDAQRLYEEKIISLERENARLRAEKELSKERKSSTKSKKTHSEYVSERKEILTSIKDKLKAARTGESGLTAVPVPYAKELFVIAPDVMKLTRSLLSEGVSKLDDIVREIHSSIKDSIDGLTEKDIHDIIAGDYNAPRSTRKGINKALVDLRTEAKLVNRLNELNEGGTPKTEKAAREKNREIESLKKKIKNHDVTKLAEAKKRISNQITDLENDLKTGNYQEPSSTDTRLPVKLDKEAIGLKDKLIKLRQQRAERLAKLKYENRTLRKRAVDRTLEIMNVPRTIMASMDYSAPLRQAVIPTVSHPIMAAKAAAEMFRQSVSQKRFDRWFFDLQQTPRYELMKRVKLYVADPHDPRLSTKEEAFMNNLAERIPFLGKLIKGSERAYVGFLNKMRVDLFNRMADGFENEGLTYENNPELYEGLARMVNNFTGRGGLGPIESTAPVLNSIFFSPRLIASRFNILGLSDFFTFGKGFYANLPPKLRLAALGDLLKFVGVGTTLLGMLSLWAMGGDDDDKDRIQVEDDARSSDFGKIRSGNTRWDIWGGFQPYVRLIAQLFTGERKATSSGQISSVNKFGQDKGTLLSRFVRGKLAPVPATALNLLTGRNIVGEKVTVKSEAIAHLQPLIVSDMKDAIKDRGVGALFTHGLPSVFGVGVQTYLPRGYDKVDTKAPVYKELYEKGLNLTTPEQSEEMDDKIYDKFTKRQRVLFKEKWDNVIKYGAYINEEGNPTIDIDRGVSIKPFNELSNTELTTLMKSISNSATRTTKKELDIKPLKK